MGLPEHTTHSFIVRVWLEETAAEADDARWRGHVTHIPSNARRYIEHLNDIVAFIEPHLEAMGVRFSRSTPGGSMRSIFSFLHGREAPTEPSIAEETPVETTAVATLEATPMDELGLPPNIAPTPEQALAIILEILRLFLPPHEDTDPWPAANVSSSSVNALSLAIGNRRGTENRGSFSAVALKGGRLNVVVRFQLWADDPGNVDSAIDDLHTGLLAAKDALWRVGFLRLEAEGSTPVEHVPSANAWRRTADYRILYEFHHEDSEGADSLIARIPIDVITDLDDEVTVVSGEMVRWDNESAPTLIVGGRFSIGRLSLLAFVPDPVPGNVTITRTFADAAGVPTPFTTLADFVTAVTDPSTPERHAQITFASLVELLNALTAVGDPIALGDWNLDTVPDRYQAYVLDFTPPLLLASMAERLEISYQGNDLNQVVLYIQAKRV